MTFTTLMILAIVASVAAFKLGAMALAGYWAARGAFSPQGLLVPAHRNKSAIQTFRY